MKNRCRIFLLILLIIIYNTTMIFSDQITDKENELNNVQDKMKVQQEKLNVEQKKVDSEASKLKEIQEQLSIAEDEYEATVKQLKDIDEKIEKNEEELNQIEKKLEIKVGLLNKRVRDIYKNGHVNYIEVLFGASDFSDFINRIELLKRIIQYDINLVKQVKYEKKLVLDKKTELENDKKIAQELNKKIKEKKDLIEKQKDEQERLLSIVVSKRDEAEKMYNDLKNTSDEIENMVRNLKRTGGKGTGTMIWPVKGEITSDYGSRQHPVFGRTAFHTGLDIGVDYGANVVAADSGVVISSGWLGGYGKAVIIDHGGGITTLYGHNSRLVVSVGQSVSKGQLIAYAGSTGYSTGPHCHFEVRINGAHTDPTNYL